MTLITDVDREAAWQFKADEMRHLPVDEARKVWFSGLYDGSKVIQAFARHRIEAEKRGALAMREAADILEAYAEYIRSVKADELERHPYLPRVEDATSELRATIGEGMV